MRFARTTLPLLLAAGALWAPVTASARPPEASASGGDVVALTYPSIVSVRIKRTETALDRATRQVENGSTAKAVKSLKTVRRQLSSAWRGARYVIRTTPPPPADEARVSGDGPIGPTYASPADSAFAVLTVQHDVAAAMVQLVDGSRGTALSALSTTLFLALDRREGAIKEIRAIAPPAAEEARARARASGDGPVVAGFDTVMPNVLGQLDDELQAIDGTRTDAEDLTAGGRRILNKAQPQVQRTRQTVNASWPPVPAED
jgi:hypothetical protein